MPYWLKVAFFTLVGGTIAGAGGILIKPFGLFIFANYVFVCVCVWILFGRWLFGRNKL